MSDQIDHERRFLLGMAAISLSAGEVFMSGPASATATKPKVPPSHTSFGPLRQIDAGTLNIGYAEAGPVHGPAVLLLHGWPYDIYAFVDVAPLLAQAGYRVIVPYLRGYGT